MTKTEEQTDLEQAVRMLGKFTAGSYEVWALSGRAMVKARQLVMATLLGHPVKQAEAGINAMRAEFYKRLSIPGDCLAIQETNFKKVCCEMYAADPETPKE